MTSSVNIIGNEQIWPPDPTLIRHCDVGRALCVTQETTSVMRHSHAMHMKKHKTQIIQGPYHHPVQSACPCRRVLHLSIVVSISPELPFPAKKVKKLSLTVAQTQPISPQNCYEFLTWLLSLIFRMSLTRKFTVTFVRPSVNKKLSEREAFRIFQNERRNDSPVSSPPGFTSLSYTSGRRILWSISCSA